MTFTKKTVLYFLIITIFISISGVSVKSALERYASRPYSASVKEPVTVNIEKGSGMMLTTKTLENQRLVRYPLIFRIYAYLKKYDKKIQAGEYELNQGMSPATILKYLTEGKVKLYKISIPEGFTVAQIAKAVESAGITNEKNFTDASRDRSFLEEAGIKADSAEGYLFPETYFFPKNTSAKKILKTMSSKMSKILTPEITEKIKKKGFTVHKMLTLASIIEKETGNPDERALISSVFHNRLGLGMRLETDPAVIYGIKNFDGNLRRKDLETLTPYNTYMISGLPPGPIANPGEASIKAAIYPADTRYLYFVSKNDSTHYFSATYSEHQNAVRRYQTGK